MLKEELNKKLIDLSYVKDKLSNILRSRGVSDLEDSSTLEDIINKVDDLDVNEIPLVSKGPVEFSDWSTDRDTDLLDIRFNYINNTVNHGNFSPLVNTRTLFIEDGVNYGNFFRNGAPLPNLKTLRLPTGTTDLPYLNGAVKLESIENITGNMSGGSFNNCQKLKSLPVTLTSLTSFWNCYELENINISSSITTIPSSCFSYCNKLDYDINNSNFTDIGYQAFYSTGISGNIHIKPNVNYSNLCFGACNKITKVTMDVANTPTNSSEIFKNCTSIEEIEITQPNTTINNQMFEGCTSLSTITGLENISTMNTNCFRNCTGLEEITFNPNVNYNGIPFLSTNPKKITFNTDPQNTVIMLVDNPRLEELIITTPLNLYGFYNSPLLHTVSWENIKTIQNYSFRYITIPNITLTSTTTSIGAAAFGNSDIEVLDLSDTNITTLPSESITRGCNKLHTLILPNVLSELPNNSLSSGSLLKEIIIPESVSSFRGTLAVYETSIEKITFNGSPFLEYLYYNQQYYSNHSIKSITFKKLPNAVEGCLRNLLLNELIFDTDDYDETKILNLFVNTNHYNITQIKIKASVYEQYRAFLIPFGYADYQLVSL